MRRGLITGVFDLLHQGHTDFISQALTQVDFLYLGIEPDVRVRQKKGPARPLFPHNYRKAQLLNWFETVESELVRDHKYQIEVLPQSFGNKATRETWLRSRQINLLFVGDDDPYLVEKKAALKKIGGRVVIIPSRRDERGQLISLTQILQGSQSPQLLVGDKGRAWVRQHFDLETDVS